jgi:hypothetical protein
VADLSTIQKSAYFPANSNTLDYFIRDLSASCWRCPRCQGVVVTEAEVHDARDPEALEFVVKQAERRHRDVCSARRAP